MRGFYGYRRYVPRRILARVLLAALLVGAAAALVVFTSQMKSMLTRMATSRVTNTVNQIVLESVNLAVDSGQFEYDRMISFEKDNEGRITAVKSNMPEFNRLQSYILREVLDRIDHVSSRDLSIPLGSLTGSALLAGRGPRITVRMESVGASTARLENEFVSAGINQTKHQVRLNIDVAVSILLPGFSTATKVSNSVVVAETVIVGSVPETYTNFTSPQPMEDLAEEYIMNR
ncbi:MAG: sporulation protein YunB [Oscillospiraceae bacterium]|nr:sporulation protein YunB [Oscillospiraceae bacterium]